MTTKHDTEIDALELPDNLDNPDFLQNWKDWQQHRKEIKKALTPMTARRQLSKLSRMGAALAIQSIDQSIEMGWQGLFPVEEQKTQKVSFTPKSKEPTMYELQKMLEQVTVIWDQQKDNMTWRASDEGKKVKAKYMGLRKKIAAFGE